jgi:hypothetical protein
MLLLKIYLSVMVIREAAVEQEQIHYKWAGTVLREEWEHPLDNT